VRVIGAGILIAVFGLLFAATASAEGFWTALGIWLAAFALTALVVLGITLLVA